MSWREAGVRRRLRRQGAIRSFAQRSPLERAVDRVHHAAPAAVREGVRRQERVQDDVPRDGLAAERSDRRAGRVGRRRKTGEPPIHRQQANWISDSPTRLRSSPARAAGSGWPARGRWWPRAAACASARAARSGWPRRRSRSRRAAKRPEHDRDRAGRRVHRGRHRAGHRPRRRDVRRPRHPRQQRRPRRRAPICSETTDAEWQAAFDETLFPAIRASRLAVPHMKQRGGGAIVMIASIWGRESGGRMTYNAVKAAEISLAKALAQQLAPANIRVNSVAPGSILFPGGSWHKRQQADPAGHRRVRSSASCRSAASAAPTKSAPSSRSSPRRAPAGSAARRSPSTAARARSNI